MVNKENLVSLRDRTTDEQRKIARMGGVASGKARRERKTIAMALRAALDEETAAGSGVTKLEAISIKAVRKIFDNPDIKDIRTLAELLGELKQTFEAAGIQLNITTTTEEGRRNVQRLVEGD